MISENAGQSHLATCAWGKHYTVGVCCRAEVSNSWLTQMLRVEFLHSFLSLPFFTVAKIKDALM